MLKKKFAILSVSTLCFVIGVLFSISSDIKYNAELTFVVEEEKTGGNLGSMSGIASQFGFDIGGSSSTTFTQENILELRSALTLYLLVLL